MGHPTPRPRGWQDRGSQVRVTCSCAWRERLRRKAPMKAPAPTSTGSATSRSPVSLGESRYSDTKQPTVWVPLRRPWGRGRSGWGSRGMGDHQDCPEDRWAHLGDGQLEGRLEVLDVGRQPCHQLSRARGIEESHLLPAKEQWVVVPVPHLSRPPSLRGLPQQGAEERLAHVAGHLLTDAGQQRDVPEGQQALQDGLSGGRGAPRDPPAALSGVSTHLQAVDSEQAQGRAPHLAQVGGNVAAGTSGHHVHQLAQQHRDVHIEQGCAQRQLRGWTGTAVSQHQDSTTQGVVPLHQDSRWPGTARGQGVPHQGPGTAAATPWHGDRVCHTPAQGPWPSRCGTGTVCHSTA